MTKRTMKTSPTKTTADKTMLDLKPIIHTILKKYPLPHHGIHGVAHWARVLENGLCLSEVIRVNVEVVQLFAIFHDSLRATVASDPSHGTRAHSSPPNCGADLFDLSDDDFDLLFVACAGHDGLGPPMTIPRFRPAGMPTAWTVGRAGATIEYRCGWARLSVEDHAGDHGVGPIAGAQKARSHPRPDPSRLGHQHGWLAGDGGSWQRKELDKDLRLRLTATSSRRRPLRPTPPFLTSPIRREISSIRTLAAAA